MKGRRTKEEDQRSSMQRRLFPIGLETIFMMTNTEGEYRFSGAGKEGEEYGEVITRRLHGSLANEINELTGLLGVSSQLIKSALLDHGSQASRSHPSPCTPRDRHSTTRTRRKYT